MNVRYACISGVLLLFLGIQAGCGDEAGKPDTAGGPVKPAATDASSTPPASVPATNNATANPATTPTDAANPAAKPGVVKSPAREVRSDQTLGGKTPAESDTLLAYYGDDPDTLNAITASDSVSDGFHRLVYEPLAQRRFDDPEQWMPVLAESWEFDPEKLEYTIRLRKGIKWHPMKLPNGKELPAEELTARDVKFTFDCILNKHVEAGHIRSYYEDPEAKEEAEKFKVKVSLVPGDKYAVKIKWTKPYFLMDDYTLYGSVIIPRHVYSVDETGEPISFDFTSKEFAEGFNNHWANTKACGTGPLMLADWKKDEQVVFERNPAYWAEPFYFSRIVYRNISNPNTALQQVLQNDLDFGSIPEKDHYIQSKTHPNVTSGKVDLVEYAYPAYRYLGYNLNRELFKDKRVRWAIGHAVPIETIIDKVYHGLAHRTTGPSLVGSPSYDTALEPLDFDLEKSKKLLDEAGWTDTNQDGTRDKMIDGQRVEAKFSLMIFSDSPSYQTIGEVIKENCRKIGIDVSIEPAKWALMLQKLRKKEFDATILGWVMDWKQDPFQLWHGSQADVPETSNHVGYKNPAVDKLIEKLRITLDADEQAKIGKEIHKLIYDDQPYTFLFSEKVTAGKHSRLENVKFYLPRPCTYSREWSSSSPRMQ